MEHRVPNRYRVTFYETLSGGYRTQYGSMWAFSAADVISQFELSQKGYSHPPILKNVEPWREDKHGPWPEHL